MVKALVKYKKTEIRWMPEIPSHWDIKKIKFSDEVIMGQSPESNSYNDKGLGIPFLQGNADFGDLYPNATVFTVAQTKIAPKNSVLYSVRAPIGAVNIANIDYCIGRGLAAIKAKENFQKFLYYVAIILKQELNSLGTGSTFTAISVSDLANTKIPIPPINEQMVICKYLDVQTEKISRFIQKKQRFIELLKEQKQSIANRFVTKGLYPNAVMKASGIDWLGEIPAHWNIQKCKNVYLEIDIRSTNGEEELLSVSHYDGVSKRSSKDVTMFMAEDYTGYKLCWPDDLVINILWAWMGALGVSKEHGIVSSAYGVYRLKQPAMYNPEFVDLMLKNQGYVTEYFKRSKGVNSSRARMYSDDFFTVPIITPPVDEQTEIVASIKQETRIINIAIDKAEKEIVLMKEYREAMIADAVMGKKI